MVASRIAPYVQVRSLSVAKQFYGDVLGLEPEFDDGERCVVFETSHPGTAQVITLTHEILTGDLIPHILVDVDDVDAVHRRARSAGLEVVYPLADEEWGVRRFFVRGPSGELINVLSRPSR